MRNQALLAAALVSVIVLVGIVHAPPAPVVIGAGLAYAWLVWWPQR